VEYRVFQLKIFILTALTAILLQILSNLANDYGDAVNGADNKERIGPDRGLQSGEITLPQMHKAIAFCVVLALVSGCWLLSIAAKGNTTVFITFLVLGLLCIGAAIKYTVGKKPYGYSGFGDISVFFFFGIVAVGGTFYLYAHAFKWDILLPSVTLGLLSAGVLNINNMRDHVSDAAAGKKTLVVHIGLHNAKRYHAFVVSLALASISLYSWLTYVSPFQWLFLIAAPLLLLQLKNIMKEEPANMDKYLKQLSLTTLLLVISFGAGILIN